ncbi:MAG: hypothetical protein M0C28_15445 [Candidatus Moduliflexus flocculans]|nr:hypothetical protein [Candidatus Moduliflexus flocculans]
MVLVLAGPVHGGKTTFLERALPQWAALRPRLRAASSASPRTDAAGARVYDLFELGERAPPSLPAPRRRARRRADRARSSSSRRRSPWPGRSSAVPDRTGSSSSTRSVRWSSAGEASGRTSGSRPSGTDGSCLLVAREEIVAGPRRRPRPGRARRLRYPRSRRPGAPGRSPVRNGLTR